MIGKMRRTSHPSRPSQKVQVLHRVHMDLCELAPGCYFSTMIDEATRFACVMILPRKGDTAAEVCTQVVWSEMQTGKRVQRVRHDRGKEYMSGQLQTFFAERGIQQDPTAGYTPEANGLAERHNLTLLDIALPMPADSDDPQRGLPPPGSQYAVAAVIYANDLHNPTPAPSALVGRTPREGFLHCTVGLSAFRRLGCRVWVHSPSHRQKVAPRALPGRFVGFEQLFGSGVVLALLDSRHVTQSQTVEFDDEPRFRHPFCYQWSWCLWVQLIRGRTTTTAMMKLICGLQSCPQHCLQCRWLPYSHPMTTAMIKLICGLHSYPQHCLPCQWLLCNLSCQPLQRCCLGS
jgi:transposase InsO family protein